MLSVTIRTVQLHANERISWSSRLCWDWVFSSWDVQSPSWLKLTWVKIQLITVDAGPGQINNRHNPTATWGYIVIDNCTYMDASALLYALNWHYCYLALHSLFADSFYRHLSLPWDLRQKFLLGSVFVILKNLSDIEYYCSIEHIYDGFKETKYWGISRNHKFLENCQMS